MVRDRRASGPHGRRGSEHPTVSAQETKRPCGNRTMRRRPMAPSSWLVVRSVCCAHTGVFGFGRQKYSRTRSISFAAPVFFELAWCDGFLGRCKFVQGLTEQSKRMQSNAGKHRTMQSNPRECRNAQRKTEQSKRLQSCTESPRRFPREYRECSCGKVEFCLPTKLHAPSLADRSVSRNGHALNAFGLFAPSDTTGASIGN